MKAIVRDKLSVDRSNIRRAIRSLLFLHGMIEISEEGERIRLSKREARWFRVFPPIPPEPIDVDRARAILDAH